MSNINEEKVEQVAKLARLELSAEEKEKYTAELGKILNYVDELNEVSGSRQNQKSQITNIARSDQITNYNDRENLLSNAPAQDKGFIKVKKVFE